MIKEIKYTGYEASTPDNLASDGSLSAAVGIVNQDGGMRAASEANAILNLPDGYQAIFIHKVSSGDENYIILDSGKRLCWLSVDEDLENIAEDYWETHRIGDGTFDSFTDIEAVGNTLVALSETTHYILWKDRSYHYLGTKIPNVDISFGVRGWLRSFLHTKACGSHSLKDTYKGIYNDAITKIDKHIADFGENDGFFVNPLFVRYAMELYDGTIVNRSCPVFMCPMKAPLVHLVDERETDTLAYYEFDYYIKFISYLIDYKILNVSKEELYKWKDVVKNINIYVSKPIYLYSLEGPGNKDYYVDFKHYDVIFRGRIMADHTNGYVIKTNNDGQIGSCNYCTDENMMVYAGYTNNAIERLNGLREREFNYKVAIAEYNEEQVASIMKGLHPCYKYYSIPIEKLVAPDYGFDTKSWGWWNGHDEGTIYGVLQEPCGAFSRRIQIPPQKILATLEQQPTIDTAQAADYYDREQLLAKNITAYNNSISLLDLKRRYNDPISPSCMFQYRNALQVSLDTDGNYHAWEFSPVGAQVNKVYIHIEENGNNYLLSKEDSYSYRHYNTVGSAYDNFLCLPYPNAKSVFIGDGTNFWGMKLSDSAFSNSKMFWLGSVSDKSLNWTIEQMNELKKTCEQENIVSLPGRIYTSETNNPFVFRPGRAISFDGADVIGMASATKALSQGQFGQFPMYAFTSDGIWALEVSASTGGYSAKQPVTRDVCINPLSITQGDNCIYFVSDRGLMLLAGSETACISDVLDDHFAQSLKDVLPGYGKFLGIAGMNEKSAAMPAFREFIKDAQIVYDYTNQRVIVFRPLAEGEKENIAFAFSLLSKTWSTMPCSLTGKINSYPDALAVMNGKGIVNLSTITDGTEGTGMLITRPLSLDMPEVHKTVDAIIQRGKFRKGCIKQALWGSRDLIHWHLVASSDSHILRNVHGTPYKWFRIGVIATLKDDEALTGCSINYTPKLTNKIR